MSDVVIRDGVAAARAELARLLGVTGMRLNVSLGNDGARRFYERLGYSQSAVRLGKALPE